MHSNGLLQIILSREVFLAQKNIPRSLYQGTKAAEAEISFDLNRKYFYFKKISVGSDFVSESFAINVVLVVAPLENMVNNSAMRSFAIVTHSQLLFSPLKQISANTPLTKFTFELKSSSYSL